MTNQIRELTEQEMDSECQRLLKMMSGTQVGETVEVDVMPYLIGYQVKQVVAQLRFWKYEVEIDCFKPRRGSSKALWRFTKEGSVRLFVTPRAGSKHLTELTDTAPLQGLSREAIQEFLTEKRWYEYQARPRRQVPHRITKRMRQEAWWRNNAYAVSRLIRGLRSSLSVQELQDLSQPTPLDRRFTPRHLPSRGLHKPKQE